MIYNVEEHLNLYDNLGVTVGSRFNSSINNSNEMWGFESLQLSHIYWIGDGPSRSRHVASEEVMHETDGELSKDMNTRVQSEPRYDLRKINPSQVQQNTLLLLPHEFEKLTIH